MTETRVLPADVYDALELSALIHGGIGADELWAWRRDSSSGIRQTVPRCIYGHARWVDSTESLVAALRRSGIDPTHNDRAVKARTRRRLSFKRWCKALNVVRGD